MLPSWDMNHFKVKLNKSDATQCLDMFPQGHWDDRDLDSNELIGKPFPRLKNMTLVENRHQYAKKIWKRGQQVQGIRFSTDPTAGTYDYERLVYRHSLRAPISHGLTS